jgi:hypothetical protein
MTHSAQNNPRKPASPVLTSHFTLAPLLTAGRDALACGDIPGFEKIVLTKVKHAQDGEPWHRGSYRAKDVFSMVEQGLYELPPLEHFQAAEFTIATRDKLPSFRLTVEFPNKLTFSFPKLPPGYSHTGPAFNEMVQTWLTKRNFIANGSNESTILE